MGTTKKDQENFSDMDSQLRYVKNVELPSTSGINDTISEGSDNLFASLQNLVAVEVGGSKDSS